jgi:hypothetical protein
MVLFQAGNCGLSVRKTAALARLPKTTVARQRIAHAAGVGDDSWHGHDPEEYVAAHDAAWSHVPETHVRGPFTVETLDDGRVIVSMRPRQSIRRKSE